MLSRNSRLLILIVCFFIFAATIKTAGAETVNFEIHWQPQTQFAGYIIAKEKGYFKKHLPDKTVEIVWPYISGSALDNLDKEKNRFCTSWFPDALYFACSKPERKIVCLSQIMQKTPVMLVTKTSSGIETPKDLDGKQIQIWKGGIDFMMQAFFEKQGVKPIRVPQGGSMMPFIYDVVPVASAMYYNEYHVLLERGLSKDGLRTFSLSDYDMNFPGDGIYCKQETWNDNPELCRGIVRASQEGWAYAIDPKNEAEVLDIVIAYGKRDEVITSRSHQRWMLRTVKEDLELNPKNWGLLRQDDYDRIFDVIRNSNDMKSTPDANFPSYSEFFRNSMASSQNIN